ncbi:MAG: ABC transporter permease [Anaerolineae bacterium]
MRFILRRLGFYLIAFFVSITINFFLPRLIPGDPVTAIIGRPGVSLTPEQLTAVRTALGLSDAPLLQQFGNYLVQLAHLDLGTSYTKFPASVISVIGQGFGWTVLLSVTAILISFTLGHLLGIFSAWRRGTLLSKSLPPFMIFIGAFPAFFLAISAVYYLGYRLHWFPTLHAFDDALTPADGFPYLLSVGQHMILPVLVMVITSLGGWALGMRNVMVSVLGEDYITLAEAKGLSPNRVMFMYAARNAMLPSVTAFGIVLGVSISGQLLIEQVFSYPGLGFMLVQAVRNSDYPLMQGLFLLITTFVLGANFVVDILYTRLDPRVRAG